MSSSTVNPSKLSLSPSDDQSPLPQQASHATKMPETSNPSNATSDSSATISTTPGSLVVCNVFREDHLVGGDFYICNRYGITDLRHLGTFRTLKAANECTVRQLDYERSDDEDSEMKDDGWEEEVDDDGCLHAHQTNDDVSISIWVEKCVLKD